MPAISKIRFTNAVYEDGAKRYNDDIFVFDGHNGAIVLENGGGKTTFLQIALQAILPHADLGDRKIRETLSLEGNPCHIGIEWILNERPRRYALTCITLFLNNGKLDSYKYVYDYGYNDENSIDNIPFVKETIGGNKRPAGREEMKEYYQVMCRKNINARTFSTIKEYHKYIEENFKIVPKEWRRIAIINEDEGGIDKFFEGCKTTENLVDRLLIPVVEEAMAGAGTQEFVDTFEEQREHFKQHNHLKESIDESKKIQMKIEEYVNIYDEYYKATGEYNKQKSYGKGIYEYIFDEQQETEKRLEEIKEAQSKYEDDLLELRRMKASYKLAILKDKLLLSQSKYEEMLRRYEIFKDELNTKEARLQNFKIARYKKKIKELEDEISFYKSRLENLDKDEEVYNLEEELNLNSSNIKSYFECELGKLSKESNMLESQKASYEQELKVLKKDRTNLNREYKTLSETNIRLDQDLNRNREDMEKILKKVLSNPETEKIEEEYLKWSNKVNYIEKYLVDCQERAKNLKGEKDSLNFELAKSRGELVKLSNNKTSITENIKNVEKEGKQLLLNIKECFPNLFHINNIYIKQEQIISTLENKCERVRKEKENLIIEERVVHRFIDDYKDNNYFTAEPLLGKWVGQWKGQFTFLETGTEYIERAATAMDGEEKEYYKLYPYWVVAVIVADNEKNRLKTKLENNLDKITYPIIILSQSSAQAILRGEGEIIAGYTCLYPSTWEDNIVRVEFEHKKSQLIEEAEIATHSRRAKEEELNCYDNLHTNTIEFLNRYPYTEYLLPLRDKLKVVEEKIYDIENINSKMDSRIEEIDQELENINNETRDLNLEKEILNNKITDGVEYIRKKRETSEINNKMYKIKRQIATKERDLLKLNKLIEKDEEAIGNLKSNIREIINLINNITKDELYIEVKDNLPIESEISIEILQEVRQDIKERLARKQKSRSAIEDNINKSYNTKADYERNLNNEINGAKYIVDYELDFPLYGEREIEILIEDIKILNPKVDKIRRERDSSNGQYIRDKTEYELAEEEFFKEYKEIMQFAEALNVVKEKINERQKELDKRYGYLKSMEEELSCEYSSINEALDLLERKNERYEYLANRVETEVLSKETIADIPYSRMKYINELVENLESISIKVKAKRDNVSKGKTAFRSFCDNSISDPRLKNMAISGIEYKDDFEELVDWKRIMDKNIDSTIRIWEQDMMQHDKEINQFIDHLHSYLKKLAEELRYIPKKTRIKVDDKWKSVYTIDVPAWEDEIGRQKLIDNINGLLKDIEDIRFKDEYGNEDKASVRKHIENRFQGKELLKNVMGNEKIKVKCRKVTNDGKVSSIPISWSKSNRWSGGERWSKNMTLFLGLLNYLAEKSQDISSNQKRNRTVILDNPFGEASSDHVLDPVFFIAEQLGFQIIALTAHGEGKYMRDFFPIIYSCRLRPSVANETQILVKEKEINYVFFKDKDPRALMRLGDTEQLSII